MVKFLSEIINQSPVLFVIDQIHSLPFYLSYIFRKLPENNMLNYINF